MKNISENYSMLNDLAEQGGVVILGGADDMSTGGTARLRGPGFIPAVADCRSQGTAISPTSAALSHTEAAKQD